jgi:predicted GTPase
MVVDGARSAGLRVVLVRHPMPYGDLEAMRVQRFATGAQSRREKTGKR